ncbi:MAG: hypothetical protein K0R72_1253 [Clostridia bacterium]|jgi:hypothetical protein|nr:hypothetical protein [Clostridia bacterium]
MAYINILCHFFVQKQILYFMCQFNFMETKNVPKLGAFFYYILINNR